MVLGLTSDIKIKVLSDKDCVQTISVEWPTSKVQEKIEEAFSSVKNQVRLPGFRPGKAPIEMVRDSYKEAAHERAQDTLLRDGVAEALKSKKINPVQTPMVKSAQFAPDKPFHFEFEVEVAPTVKPSNYKGMKLNKTAKPVTDADVQKALDRIVDMNAKLVESTAEALGNTHFAVINYQGFLEGKPIEGAQADQFLLDMAAPQAIAGLSEGLVGAKPGEEREVKVKFPEDSPAKELAGKEATFKVKLNAIKEKKVAVIDDEFAKDLGVESLADLKKRVRQGLEKERDDAARADLERQVLDKLVEEHKFAVPASLVQKQIDHLLRRQTERLMQQGVAKEDLSKAIEQIKPEAKNQAEREVKLAYIMNAISDVENIEATDAEVNQRIAAITERAQGQEKSQMEKALRGSYLGRIQSEVREAKLFTWLIDHAKVKEISGGNS